jgi:predicted short-subunit dehydrogenase-like oxidoreductase (DUF2520 family)
MEAQQKLTLSIAGSGNVGSFLATELFNAGFTIRQIYSRTLANAEKLALKVNAQAVDSSTLITDNIDLLVIALPDNIIPIFCEELSKSKPASSLKIATTAGSVSLNEIKRYFNNCGVIYPLQSITKITRPDVKSIPFCLEGTNELIKSLLVRIASAITDDIRDINSEQRLLIHLAAVFASNFTNHLIAIADDIISKGGIDRNILWPLINETVSRLKNNNPLDIQTGPAKRNDTETMAKHMELIRKIETESIGSIYKIISNNIAIMSTSVNNSSAE